VYGYGVNVHAFPNPTKTIISFFFFSKGDPYEKKRPATNTRIHGKQFGTLPPKKGQTAGFFGTFAYKPSPYQVPTVA
jgi:hypothetical protein